MSQICRNKAIVRRNGPTSCMLHCKKPGQASSPHCRKHWRSRQLASCHSLDLSLAEEVLLLDTPSPRSQTRSVPSHPVELTWTRTSFSSQMYGASPFRGRLFESDRVELAHSFQACAPARGKSSSQMTDSHVHSGHLLDNDTYQVVDFHNMAWTLSTDVPLPCANVGASALGHLL